jgi:hypothetical protein
MVKHLLTQWASESVLFSNKFVMWDEDALDEFVEEGKLLEFMKTIPRDQWNPLLMYKIITDDEDNIDALIILLKAGVDPDGGVDSYVSRDFINDRYETTCSYDCIENGSPRKLQIMLASGKCSFYWPYYEEYGDKHTPCLESLSNRHTENWEAKHRILISNGYHDDDKLLDRYGIEFQKLRFSYVQCRKVIVTLLALKRRRIHSMSHLDRFLVKELAFAIWITRYDWPLPEEPKHGRVIDVFGGTVIALGFAYLFPKMIGMLL